MNELLQSKFFQDLKSGKLPEVQASLTQDSLFGIGAMLVLVISIGLLANKILKTL
jgi:hypothetical protein